jgi:hypothetical protein
MNTASMQLNDRLSMLPFFQARLFDDTGGIQAGVTGRALHKTGAAFYAFACIILPIPDQ